MNKDRGLHYVSLVLAIIGAINWGLVGLFQFDLIAAIFGGQGAILSRIIYTVVGLAGIVLCFTTPRRVRVAESATPLRRAA